MQVPPMSRAIIKYRVLIAIAWSVVSVGAIWQALNLAGNTDLTARWKVGESAEVKELLDSNFKNIGGNQLLVVLEGVDYHESDSARIAVYDVFDSFREEPLVQDLVSPASETSSELLIRSDVAVGIVSLDKSVNVQTAIEELRQRAREILAEYLADTPDARLYITGRSAIDYDFVRLSGEHVRASELLALPILLGLLVWVFGGLVAAVLPVLVAGLSIAITMGFLSVLATYIPVSNLAQSMGSLLGLALATDYALLMVARFREQILSVGATDNAIENTIREAGSTVVRSGGAVIIGFLGLLILPIAELRAVAIAGILVTGISVLIVTTLLPNALALLGSKVNAVSVRPSLIGQTVSRHWQWWSDRITRKPAIAAVACTTALVAVALPARDIELSFPDEGWVTAEVESMTALRVLEDKGMSGLVHQLTVVYTHPDDQRSLDEAGWGTLKSMTADLLADERVERVISLPALFPPSTTVPELEILLSETVKDRFTDPEQRYSILQVLPKAHLTSDELMGLARDLRESETPIMVGGLPAATLDYLMLFDDWAPIVFVSVVAGTLVALYFSFGSLLIPVKAVFLNLITLAATFGIFQLLFSTDIGSSLVGLTGPIDGVFPAIPLMVFCAIFGVSMDYEIFLLSRVAQVRREAESERDAIRIGLASTGRLITNAALIMIAVFGAFAIGDYVPLKMLGVALMTAVILDATLVRMVLSPTILVIAGRYNWWPRDYRNRYR
jgi:RND superfamily putative drug exporter